MRSRTCPRLPVIGALLCPSTCQVFVSVEQQANTGCMYRITYNIDQAIYVLR